MTSKQVTSQQQCLLFLFLWNISNCQQMYFVKDQLKDRKQMIFDEFDKIGGNKPDAIVLKCKHCGLTFNLKTCGLK